MKIISYHADALGYLVLYGTTAKKDVPYKEALACIQEHGWNEKILPRPTKKAAFARSLKKREKARKDIIVQMAHSTPTKQVMLELRETPVPHTAYFELVTDTTATLDKVHGEVIAAGPDKEAIEKGFLHFSKYVTGGDLRQMTHALIESFGGISLRGSADVRDAGGIYFVPGKYAKQLQALAEILAELKIGYLKTFAVLCGAAEQQSLFGTLTSFIGREIADIRAGLSHLKVRASSARKYEGRLNELSKLLADYATLCKAPNHKSVAIMRELDAAIGEARDKAAKLGQNRRARAAMTVSPRRTRAPMVTA